MQLTLLVLLYGGGVTFWSGLLSARYTLLTAGAALLGTAFILMLWQGHVSPLFIPVLVFVSGLALSLKVVQQPIWQVVGWTLYILMILALGFHLFPPLRPIPLFAATGTDTVPMVWFSPEKVILMWLVPTMVLVPWASRQHEHRSSPEKPRMLFVGVLAATLATLIPLAMAMNYIRPGITSAPLPALLYSLAYNLVFVCILEESFFRGILQNALIRGFHRIGLRYAAALGIVAAAALFGVAHFAGGATYVGLAAVAGIGYGTAYYLTQRLHYAVLIHFMVNAVHQIGFAAPTG